MTTLSPKARKALEKMLLSMFSASELRRLVRYLPQGRQLSQRLPGRGSSALRLVEDTIEALDSFGVLDNTFFDLVIEERPRRKGEVEQVRKLIAKDAPEASLVDEPGPTSAARPIPEKGAPRVFVAHRRETKDQSRKLAHWLLNAGVDVWFDEWEIRGGDNFILKMNEGLQSCVGAVLVIGPSGVEDSWSSREYSTLMAWWHNPRADGIKPFIIPVLTTPQAPVPALLNTVMGRQIDDQQAILNDIVHQSGMQLSAPAQPSSAEASTAPVMPTTEPPSFRRRRLLTDLRKLRGTAFDDLLFILGVSHEHVDDNSPQARRVIQLLKYLEDVDRLDELDDTIEAVRPK